MEQPRFGKNAWYQHPDTASSYRFDHLESPYLDLSNSTNTSICFWYRLFSERKRFDPYTLFKIHVPYLAPVDFVEFFATNQQYRVIPQRPGLGWDCTCIDLSEFDGSTYTKFRILWETRSVVTDRAYKYKFISIDDVYVLSLIHIYLCPWDWKGKGQDHNLNETERPDDEKEEIHFPRPGG